MARGGAPVRSFAELADLTGRKALLVGGAGHIALAAGEALCELGAEVAVADVDPDACAARAKVLSERRRGEAWPLAVDLRSERSARDAVVAVVERAGRLDILVHCAAYVGTTQRAGWAVPFAQQSVEAWDEAMRVNLTSAFVLAQEAAPALAASGRGSIVLFSSIYGLVGPDGRLYEGTTMANPVGYGASKAAIVQLARSLATTLAPHVRVNCVSPGGVLRGQPEPFRRRYVERTPLARMATEEDLKGAVGFLASDLSSYVTGHDLVVDGGWTAW